MKLIILPLIILLGNSCSYFLPKLIPFENLPKPTGSFDVGTQLFYWEDESREEWFTDDPNDFRKLVVQVWYPAQASKQERTSYIDHPIKRKKPMSEQIGLPAFLIGHLGDVQTNAILDGIPIKHNNPIPLIIFSHGLGGMRMQNSIQMEELASRGYFVLAADHPFDANITFFADGSQAAFKAKMRSEVKKEEFWSVRLPQINTRSKDLIFILDHLEILQSSDSSFWSLLDLSQVGLMGHSFGGGTAIVSSILDDRFDVCVALDGWLEPIEQSIIERGMNIPFLYIGRPEWDDPINYENLHKLIAASSAPVEKLLLEGTKHFDYADIPHFTSVSGKIGVSGSMPSIELLDTLNSRITSFFDRYLR